MAIDRETIETVRDYFGGLQYNWRWWLQPWNKKKIPSWKKSYDQPRQPIKKQRHYFANKCSFSQSYAYSRSHVWMWKSDWKKAEHWQVDAFGLRRSNQSILEEISPEYSFGRTDAEAETLILWPPDEKNWLIWKDPEAGKDWRLEEKGMTEDEMVGWHHGLDAHEFE